MCGPQQFSQAYANPNSPAAGFFNKPGTQFYSQYQNYVKSRQPQVQQAAPVAQPSPVATASPAPAATPAAPAQPAAPSSPTEPQISSFFYSPFPWLKAPDAPMLPGQTNTSLSGGTTTNTSSAKLVS